tara:strand:- start:2039 stop:2221 length:183 start_codon:yes stop_codon:yes gene_type:complete
MAKPNLITTKELIEKIKIDVVNDNITQIIDTGKNGNSIGAYSLIINLTIDLLQKNNLLKN